jgi:hypothetical protein
MMNPTILRTRVLPYPGGVNNPAWCSPGSGWPRLCLAGLLGLVLLARSGWAVDYAWTGAAGDQRWANAGNWIPEGVPEGGDDVTIGASVPVFTVVLEGNVAVRSLQSEGTLVLANHGLSVRGGVSRVTGAVTVGAGGWLNAEGSGTELHLDGPTLLDDASFAAVGGAWVEAAGLVT